MAAEVTVSRPGLFFGAEKSGAAAGAMLTMIAQTIPETCFKGGSIIGFSTLLGFLATIFLKTLE